MVVTLQFCPHACTRSNPPPIPNNPLLTFFSDHFRFVEFSIGKKALPLPNRFNSLQQLCQEVFSNFSAMNLRHSTSGKKISRASKPAPVESQYQDEFYGAFNRVVGRGVPIASEWSRTIDGRVDFYIAEKRWAIELLRDHSNIGEHVSRFKVGGRYYPWLQEHMVEDWIIIDCATTLPTTGMFFYSTLFLIRLQLRLHYSKSDH